MADRLSKAKVEQLGKRLIAGDRPSADDLVMLHEILLVRSEQLEGAIARVRIELDLAPTSRVKNTGTILEKLRRQGGWTLASMQDLAGMRVVGDFDRRGQDEVVARLCVLFGDEDRVPKVIDRRAEPMHGYRAVHVIVFPEGEAIEIQVRTARQHEWAELFEKLADLVGRGIRYGERPESWRAEGWTGDPAKLRELVDVSNDVRAAVVTSAHALGNWIAVLEEIEARVPDASELEEYRQRLDVEIAAFRRHLVDDL